jgi:hypothetical protein
MSTTAQTGAVIVENGVMELLNSGDPASTESVTLLAGIESGDESVTRDELQAYLEELGGQVERDLGFDIYRIEVPRSAVRRLTETHLLEYIEYPDLEGGPRPMDN